MRSGRSILARVTFFILCVTTAPSHAGISGGPSNAAESGHYRVSTPEAGTTLGELSKPKLLASAARLGDSIYVESSGGKIFAEATRSGNRIVLETTNELTSLPEKLASPEKRFVMSRETALALGEALKQLVDGGTTFVVEPVLGPMKVDVLKSGGRTSFFREIEPGVLANIETPFSTELANTLAAPAPLENVRVASVYSSSDVDSFASLARVAGDRLINADDFGAAIRSRSLAKYRGKMIIVVGHVEDGSFVARLADGSVSHSIPFQQLESLAKADNITVISFGCTSYCQGAKAGFAGPVTDRAAAESISAVFESRTTGEMLSAFAKEGPFVISDSSISSFLLNRRLQLEDVEGYDKAASSAGHIIRIYIAGKDESENLIAKMIACFYLIGTVSLLMKFSSNRSSFIRVHPRLPTTHLPNHVTGYILQFSIRELIFILVAPVISGVAVFAVVFGSRKHQEILDFCWTLFRNPLRVLKSSWFADDQRS
ncbi:hypothetical protein [Burkholderia ubonensis]|uniref:hypothetical protein n=1 Tax=Burkholderia ubonensis TaxID=101571 RepID=UPI000A74D05E|nr:hypothetical protein [Burkholderia ubonensis]